MDKIDFVITWVDGNDKEWQKEKAKYQPSTNSDTRMSRYRDWNNLKYWFRGVEKFAPWVNKVFFITCGHLPQWLNQDNEKLVVVKHEDYIPHEWLPTFSSRTIDMNFHRIEQLSEKFVYFNDDMFITAPVKMDDFFRNGLPCDTAILNAMYFVLRENTKMYLAPLYNTFIINKYFRKEKCIRENLSKWFNFRYGLKSFRTLLLYPWNGFTGFMNYHLPYSYLKETYVDCWAKNDKSLSETCSHRFRQENDYNHWIFNYWQMASGNFSPRNPSIGKQINLQGLNNTELLEEAKRKIFDRKCKFVCLNDAVPDADFEYVRDVIISYLDTLLPDKSSFEM